MHSLFILFQFQILDRPFTEESSFETAKRVTILPV